MHSTQSGILLPGVKPGRQSMQCGFCPNKIYRDQEAGHRLFVLSGKPICPRCRILRGRMGDKIKNDRAAYERDLREKEKFEQAKADADAIITAEISQRNTQTKIYND